MIAANERLDEDVSLLRAGERRVLSLLANVHHWAIAALVVLSCNTAMGIAVACYGLMIGLVLVSLRVTRERNMRLASAAVP